MDEKKIPRKLLDALREQPPDLKIHVKDNLTVGESLAIQLIDLAKAALAPLPEPASIIDDFLVIYNAKVDPTETLEKMVNSKALSQNEVIPPKAWKVFESPFLELLHSRGGDWAEDEQKSLDSLRLKHKNSKGKEKIDLEMEIKAQAEMVDATREIAPGELWKEILRSVLFTVIREWGEITGYFEDLYPELKWRLRKAIAIYFWGETEDKYRYELEHVESLAEKEIREQLYTEDILLPRVITKDRIEIYNFIKSEIPYKEMVAWLVGNAEIFYSFLDFEELAKEADYYARMTDEELAAIDGVKPATIRKRRQRANERIRASEIAYYFALED